MSLSQVLLAACAALCAGCVAFAQTTSTPATASTAPESTSATDPFAKIPASETALKTPEGAIEATYRYRLVEPAPTAIADPGARVPLVVFLHGSGERGGDNRAQLIHFAGACATEEFQTKAPCYVLAMQCPSGEMWCPIDIKAMREKGEATRFAKEPTRVMRALMQSIDEVMATKAVDPRRVYLTGLSMGGFGAFDLAARQPERFAAVVPICGGGDPSTAATLADVPFFIVHGTDDPVVPVALSRTMRDAIAAAAATARVDSKQTLDTSKPDATSTSPPKQPSNPTKNPTKIPTKSPAKNPMYREYDRVGHDSWTPAYRFGDSGILDWMFAQRKD